MPTVDERLAFVEGRLAEQSQMFTEVRDALRNLEQRMDTRLAAIDQRLTTDFRWIVGIQVTTLIAVIAALVGALATR